MSIIGIALLKTFKPIGEPNCYDIVLHTSEISRDTVASLHDMMKGNIKYYLTDENVSQTLTDELDKMTVPNIVPKNKMTLSQEMKWEIKLLWEKMEEPGQEWKFYEKRMRLMIDQIKDRRKNL